MSRSRSQFARRIILLIACSAIFSVLLSWGMSICWPRTNDSAMKGMAYSQHETLQYQITRKLGWTSVEVRPTAYVYHNEFYWYDANNFAIPDWAAHYQGEMYGFQYDDVWQRYYEAYGFPVPAMFGSVMDAFDIKGLPVQRSTGEGMEFRSPIPDSSPWSIRVLPFTPIWPGLLIDTAFYACLFLALRCVYLTIKHRSRRKRGLCIQCAYNLSGGPHKQCPECGTPTPRSTTAVADCTHRSAPHA